MRGAEDLELSFYKLTYIHLKELLQNQKTILKKHFGGLNWRTPDRDRWLVIEKN